MTEQETDRTYFNIRRTLNRRITSEKLRAERERYRVRPRRSPRGHVTTRHHDENRVRYWRSSRHHGFFLVQVKRRFYRVTQKGYLVQEFGATYSGGDGHSDSAAESSWGQESSDAKSIDWDNVDPESSWGQEGSDDTSVDSNNVDPDTAD